MRSQAAMVSPIQLPARAVSGVILSAVAIYAVIAGGAVFGAVVAILAVGALREWHRLINHGKVAPETMVSALATSAAVFMTVFGLGIGRAAAAISGGAILALLMGMRRRQAPFWHLLGPVYVGVPAVSLVLLRNLAAGEYLLLGIFIAVWSTDTGALFGGRLIGGPRLAPSLSPNKTWAGFLCGTASGGIAEMIYAGVLHSNLLLAFVFGMAIGVVGHAGDLFESAIKRKFHAKDSGGLIPGHGGILDRIDSLLFVAPACALFVMLTGIGPI